MLLCFKLAYTGTNYFGWQRQADDQAMRTIQGQLEHALAKLAGEAVCVHGAGRTDSGVHAEEQFCHCAFPDERYARLRDMRHSLNAILPRSIRVYAVYPVPDSFHSRFSPHVKTYRYQFWQDRGAIPPALVPYVWQCGPLQREKMEEALPYLVGVHDFAFLANAGVERASTVRTICEMELAEKACHPDCRPMLVLHVSGTGFLKQMVRNMAGLLAEIGRGRLPASSIPDYMAKASRQLLPTPTAPPEGLTLTKIVYDQDFFGAAPVSPARLAAPCRVQIQSQR